MEWRRGNGKCIYDDNDIGRLKMHFYIHERTTQILYNLIKKSNIICGPVCTFACVEKLCWSFGSDVSRRETGKKKNEMYNLLIKPC